MRKYLAILMFGGCALMAPLCAASAESATEASTAVLIEQAPTRVSAPGWRDEASMLLVGTALIWLAGVVRRAA